MDLIPMPATDSNTTQIRQNPTPSNFVTHTMPMPKNLSHIHSLQFKICRAISWSKINNMYGSAVFVVIYLRYPTM